MHTNEWNTMDAVVLAAGEGTRLRPLTDDKPKGMVEVDDQPILTHCFDQLVELGADELIVVVGYLKERIIDQYGDEYEGVPITYTHQREQRGLAHALLSVEEHIDALITIILRDTFSQPQPTNLGQRQRVVHAPAAVLFGAVA